MGHPAVETCGTTRHFEFLLNSIKVFMRSNQGKRFKVFMTCSSRVRANIEARAALQAQLRATAYTSNTDTQRATGEMRAIDEFFNCVQFVSASSTIDVGIDSLVHFQFIIAITRGGTSLPSSHLQAAFRVSRILKMDFTLLWCIDEAMPKPDTHLSAATESLNNLTLDTLADKQRFHQTMGTGTMPMHPKLVAIYTENALETKWNATQHAVLVRETLRLNQCYNIVEPCDIVMPGGVFSVTGRDVAAMEARYVDVSPSGIGDPFANARDVALEISDAVERHKHSLNHFGRSVAQLTHSNPALSERDAEYVVLANCSGALVGGQADPDVAKLDASTLESCLLDTYKVVRYTGLAAVDAVIVAEMERTIDRYVLGVAALKGHMAAEHHVMSLQKLSAPKRLAGVGLFNDLANKVRFAERAADQLRVRQLVPTSAEHLIYLPEVMVNRINRLMRHNAIPADLAWMNELSACARGVSDQNAARFWDASHVLKMLCTLFAEVGNCLMATETRPLSPEEHTAFVAALLAREGLHVSEDAESPPPAAISSSASTVAPATGPSDLAAVFEIEQPAVQPQPESGRVDDTSARRLEVIAKASRAVHYIKIAIRLYGFEYTKEGGKVATGATRLVQENDDGEQRIVVSAAKEEQRKRRNANANKRRGASKRVKGGAKDASTSSATASMEVEDVAPMDALNEARQAAALYNAGYLGQQGGGQEDGEHNDGATQDNDLMSVSSASVASSSTAVPPTAEDKAREARCKAARKTALKDCTAAAKAEVAEYKGTADYCKKLAAAIRRLKQHEFQPTQFVARFDDDAHEVKMVYPLLLMQWTNTVSGQAESPFCAASTMLDERGQQVLMESLLRGYRDFGPHELDDTAVVFADGRMPASEHACQVGQLRGHTLADGYETGYELYPLERTTKLLAAMAVSSTHCPDVSNIKELFKQVILLPVKTKTDYQTATIINALQRLLSKGIPDFENNTLKVPVTYRPGNGIVGVSRSYASYPSMQTIPNIVRIATMGPHLHDMDIANSLPTATVIGLLMLGEDPQAVWPIGMEYVMDRSRGISSGNDEKRFQQRIVSHYQYKITIDHAKELLHIAKNNGRFEYYLQKEHGVRTECHARELVQMREQTLKVRELFLSRGDVIFGNGEYTTLKRDVYQRKAFACDDEIYTHGALPDDTEKGKRTIFALGLQTIERRMMRVPIDVARDMGLVVFSSIHDGLQLIHPRDNDWMGKLEAYRSECHEQWTLKFNTPIFLVEKPFYLTGVAQTDGGSHEEGDGTVAQHTVEAAFGKQLQTAYGMA